MSVSFVNKALPVRQLVAQQCLANGRGIDDLMDLLIGQRSPGHATDLHLHGLDAAAHHHGGVGT